MNVYFTSDFHFSHKRIIDYCPETRNHFRFADGSYDLDSMNEALIEMWNKAVKPEDIVYFLGDWSLHPKNRDRYLPKLNGKIVWIKGNHDYKSRSAFEVTKNIVFYGDVSTVEFNGKRYLLFHSPFDYNRYLNEYERYNGQESLKNLRIICGHVHEKWKVKTKGDFVEAYITSDHAENGFITNHPIINVGCDAWNFSMVSLEELEMLFERIE